MVSESFYYAKRGISEENKIWGEVLSGYASDSPPKKERKTWRSVVSYFNAPKSLNYTETPGDTLFWNQ